MKKQNLKKFISDDIENDKYSLLMDKIYRATGCDFREYKNDTIKRRLGKRLKAGGRKTYQEYIEYLDTNPQEYNYLISTLIINVTQFFRDKEAWRIIKDRILPEILTRSKSRKAGRPSLNVWSIACASGEETYSLAIIFHELLKDEFKKFNVRIYGTDIDEESLNMARSGIYDRNKLQNIDSQTIKRYFHRKSPDTYQIKDEIKKTVRFLRHSIINGEKFGGFDFVVCRNLLIYFTRPLQEKIYLKLYSALRPEGFLWLGRAETPVGEAGRLFKVLSYREKIFKR